MAREPSRFEPLGPLFVHDNARLAGEEPLFAASRDYAWRVGGPITRMFLQSLPEDWQRGRLVVDSELVWLVPGLCACTEVFYRETYPVAPANVAYRLANAELDVEHVAACFGPSALEVIVGELDWDAMPRPADDTRGRWDEAGVDARDAWLRERIAAGEVQTRRIGEGERILHDGRTFLRRLPAEVPGFSFFVRISRGSRRPFANGIRTNMGTDR